MENAEHAADGVTVDPDASFTSRTAARAIGGAAAIIMAGNLASSVLGFARGSIVAATFGLHRSTDAFVVAQIVPQMFYDLTIGAAVSAALIPTFTTILGREGRVSLARTLGAVLGLAWIVLVAVVLVLEVLARPLVALMVRGHIAHAARQDPVTLVHIILPSLLLLGTSAIFLSTLYSCRRFGAASFASCCYHLGIIGGALFLGGRLGVAALAIGAVAGAGAQAAFQVPSLIAAVGVVRPRLAITPEIRRILRLYLPVSAGLIVSVAGQIVDIGFKYNLGSGVATAMSFATALTQFPIGITVAALGFATLRAISTHAADGDLPAFKATLATGLRLVLFLTVPAALAYLALASPICALIYQHQSATVGGVDKIAVALDGYAIQIPFVGVDQLLIAAFYARGNTVTPMLLGVAGVAVYVVCALLLQGPLHIFGLALANTIQNSVHGLVLLALLLGSVGTLRGYGLWRGIVRTGAAGMALIVAAIGTERAVTHVLPGTHFVARFAAVSLPLAAAGVVYLAVAAAVRSDELALLRHLVEDRLSGARGPATA